ncbi:MAG: CHAT domain-containing protein [Promethearchaeota archaeon]
MKRFRILLVNCTDGTEPSEVTLLSEFFRMMMLRYPKSVQFSQVDVRNKRDFMNQLILTWPNIIHISAHGTSHKFSSGRRGKNTSIFVGDECITAEDISSLQEIPRKLVSVSACFSSYRDLANSFLNLGARHYLAPKTKVDWVEAAMFFVMFYKRYLYDKEPFEDSYDFACEKTETKDFKEYWYSK